MSNIFDLFKFPKFKPKRLPYAKGDGLIGCSNCENIHFLVLEDEHGAKLRCTSCYTEVSDIAIISVANAETSQDKPVIT